MTEKERFRTGKGMFEDYPSEAIIDEKTSERYYDGIKPNYISSKEICAKLNGYEHLLDKLREYKDDDNDAWDLMCENFECADDYARENKYLKEENTRILAMNKKVAYKLESVRDYINKSENIDKTFLKELVDAEQVTMTVDSKHLVGVGSGNTPFDVDEFCNVVYVISERQRNGGPDKYIVQEYPVSLDDYSKIKIGDKVTLESPRSRTDFWKVTSIN